MGLDHYFVFLNPFFFFFFLFVFTSHLSKLSSLTSNCIAWHSCYIGQCLLHHIRCLGWSWLHQPIITLLPAAPYKIWYWGTVHDFHRTRSSLLSTNWITEECIVEIQWITKRHFLFLKKIRPAQGIPSGTMSREYQSGYHLLQVT